MFQIDHTCVTFGTKEYLRMKEANIYCNLFVLGITFLQSRPIEMRILHRNERCSKACSAHFAPAAYFTAATLFFLPFCE